MNIHLANLKSSDAAALHKSHSYISKEWRKSVMWGQGRSAVHVRGSVVKGIKGSSSCKCSKKKKRRGNLRYLAAMIF